MSAKALAQLALLAAIKETGLVAGVLVAAGVLDEKLIQINKEKDKLKDSAPSSTAACTKMGKVEGIEKMIEQQEEAIQDYEEINRERDGISEENHRRREMNRADEKKRRKDIVDSDDKGSNLSIDQAIDKREKDIHDTYERLRELDSEAQKILDKHKVKSLKELKEKNKKSTESLKTEKEKLNKTSTNANDSDLTRTKIKNSENNFQILERDSSGNLINSKSSNRP